MVEDKHLVVVGTSAGGMQALIKLISQLPTDFPSPVFIVQHVSVDSSIQVLVDRLKRYTSLTCKVAEDGDEIEASTIYMAPVDRHILLTEKQVLVVRGARENQFRPSIDPLFRSAAAYHRTAVIGIILTGFMSDGVVGMEMVARCGGRTVVQMPEDAEYPFLPENVLRQVKVDHVAAVADMGELLVQLVSKPVPAGVAIPTDIWEEAKMTERIMKNSTMTSIEELESVGTRAAYSCPDCGGGL
ncbi:chemotaxis protein CheB [Pontibacter qinzhouensis]|uniref:protein-glutamate methylesterase n=1 Tax=Pontibacter qinzhouensis TaxID=2603253 RepID=A0A5C8J0L5_9BACT|nr:chemotaxis protein CheB [Pontibacter qinzhouensis]TXK27245.1 chemotaxis protein CheB [Pontibacter qinzhouensis]